MHWFGAEPFSRACMESKQVRVPVGESCFHCAEPIEERDCGYFTPYVPADEKPVLVPYHYACFLRQAIGSLAHVQRRCSCYVPGASETDPTDMTTRKAAEAAVAEWERQQNERADY